jgi:CDP-glycerol glycerophosphotransferase (TagB/SpsB family)
MLKILKAIVYIASFLVNISTRFLKVKKNRVVFISYFMNTPEGNFKAIADELEKSDYEIIFLLKKYNKTNLNKISSFFSMIKQAFYFNTAKVIILDGNSVVMKAIVRKRNTFVIQIWHASGALKKFGNDASQRLYGIRSCDYAFVSSKKVTGIYSRALSIPEDRILPIGSPRTDSLFCEEKVNLYKSNIHEKYSIHKNNKVVLFAPTFRGKGVDDSKDLEIDIARLSKKLPKGFVLAVRLHPMISSSFVSDEAINFSDEDLIEVLSTADILISDYSSIFFEYSILNRPMIFFAPDLDEYIENRGFYVEYGTFMPGPIVKTREQLCEAIAKANQASPKAEKIKNEYFEYHDGLSAKRAALFIDILKNQSSNTCIDVNTYIEMIEKE